MDKIYYELTITKSKEVKGLDPKSLFKTQCIDDFCYRCGNDKLIKYKNIIYCNNCIEFGRVTKDDVFYTKYKEDRDFKYDDLLSEIKYTSLQLGAANFILENMDLKKDCLIHAVCGAGKTEISFLGISRVLKKNQYICFAIPRIDILYEVSKRLRYYFPHTRVCVLNGNEDKIQHGQIYVMTTNQIIKFKNAFSLIIVDEIDAYPYETNPKYDYGVNAAKKSTGIVVYLTSTPSSFVLSKKLPTFTINRRWHRMLLPVPTFINFDLKEYLNSNNKTLISYLNNCPRQVMLFISNIKQGKDVLYKLKVDNVNVEFVYASCDKRKELITDFRDNKFKVLLTTTILERGVTFDDVDVIILDACNTLYNKASLIQIAGRVGRKKEYQDGEVIFFGTKYTKVMKDAILEIKKLNR